MGVMLKPDPPLNIGFKTRLLFTIGGLIGILLPSVALNSVVHEPIFALLFVLCVLFMGAILGVVLHRDTQAQPKRDARGRFVKVNNE